MRGKAATPGFFGAEDGTFTPTVYSMGSGWAFGSSSASWTPIAEDFDNDGEIDSGLLQNSTLLASVSGTDFLLFYDGLYY